MGLTGTFSNEVVALFPVFVSLEEVVKEAQLFDHPCIDVGGNGSGSISTGPVVVLVTGAAGHTRWRWCHRRITANKKGTFITAKSALN